MARGGGTGVCVPECSRDCLIRWIDFPELPLRTHVRETLKCGRSSLVVRAEVPIGDRMVQIAYKRYSRRNFWKVVCGALKSSRALRAWRLGHRLREQGIETPRPLVAVTPRSLARRVDSYLATEFVEGFPLHELADRISRLTRSEQVRAVKNVAEDAGRLLGRLHGSGFRHRDLKTANLLITGDLCDAATVKAVLIDLDGVSRPSSLSRSVRIRDLSRLCVCFGPELRLRLSAAARFVRAYLAACDDSHWQWRDCWRRLVAATVERGRQRRRKHKLAA